jgi:hypothetical protein
MVFYLWRDYHFIKNIIFLFLMLHDHRETRPSIDPIEEAREKFAYANYMAHLANTEEEIDYWNTVVDNTKAELFKAIREDEEKNGGLKIRTFQGYDVVFGDDAAKNKKAEPESDVSETSDDAYDMRTGDTPATSYTPETKPSAATTESYPDPEINSPPPPHAQPKKDTKENFGGGDNRDKIKKEIIELALAHLGHIAPDDFNIETHPLYSNISKLYDFTKVDLLTRYAWKFAIVERKLYKLGKYREYQFIYELPPDLLKIQKLIPNCNYEIRGGILLSTADNIVLSYVTKVANNSFPEFFKTLLVYSLAAASAALVTQNETIARKWELEANTRFCIAVANDSAEAATSGVTRNQIYMSHFF